MKKNVIYGMLMLLTAAGSCTPEETVPDTAFHEILLPASEGSVSVVVESDGGWTAEVSEPWLSLDHGAAYGKAAVTVKYAANVPQVYEECPDREGVLYITKEDGAERIRVIFRQFGLNGAGILPDNAGQFSAFGMTIEYRTERPETVTVLYCSSEGVEDRGALQEWLDAQEADVKCMDAGHYAIDDMNFTFATFDRYGDLYAQTKDLCADAGTATRRFIGGTLYFMSVMEVGCVSAPEWYPSSVYDGEFECDLYFWNRRFKDCIYLSYRDFAPTYTDEEDRVWRADYVYAGAEALQSLRSVEILPLPEVNGMKHKPIELTVTR